MEYDDATDLTAENQRLDSAASKKPYSFQTGC
jgi:hypothetical protein